MPLQKNITTPAGNILGTYGAVTQVNIIVTAKGMAASSCALDLYASADAQAKGLPAVASYWYGLRAVAVQPSDNFLADAEAALLKVTDSGTFVTISPSNPQARSTWVPGWVGASQVAQEGAAAAAS